MNWKTPIARVMGTLGAALALGLGLMLAPAAAIANDEPEPTPESQPASQPTTTQATSTQATSTQATQEAEEEDQPQYLAVTHARVHTITGPTLNGVTILCKDGVVEAIGASVVIPDEAEVVDAGGMEVYPGLIAAGAGGVLGGGNPEDTTDLYGLNLQLVLATGITASLTGNTVARHTLGTTEGMLVRENVFTPIDYNTRRPLQRAKLEADFERVRRYLVDLRNYQRAKARGDDDAEEPDKEWLKGPYETYRRLMAGEATAVATANDRQAILDYAALARRFGFPLVLRGAVEGWTVAKELGQADVSCIVTPRASDSPNPLAMHETGASIENAAILHAHGVPVAIIPETATITLWGLAGRDLQHLNLEAGFAVRGGMSNDDALRAITIDAARILGVDDQLGSIEVGKAADLVIADGELLHYMTQVHKTIVNGKLVYDKVEDPFFGHIRPTGEPEIPQFDDQWPRPLTWIE